MDPIIWLEQRAPGFKRLPDANRQALFHFLMLWSLYEHKSLGNSASASRILSTVHEWADQGKLQANKFAGGLQYFRSRYFDNGESTPRFAGLNLRPNDSPDMVRTVLAGTNDNAADGVAALLIVVYRLRNNLFHGAKWDGDLRNQHSNFTHANTALMTALGIAGV